MGEPAAAADRFPCSLGGPIAAGRRRLGRLLIGLCLLMMTVAAVTLGFGRPVPAALAALVGAVAFVAWQMSGDLTPLWLEVGADELAVQCRRRRITLPLPPLAARRLRVDELRHLERLAAAGGVVAGSGGFDSHRLGEFDLYASDLANAVLVEGEELRLVVTPDDPDGFLTRLSATMPGS